MTTLKLRGELGVIAFFKTDPISLFLNLTQIGRIYNLTQSGPIFNLAQLAHFIFIGFCRQGNAIRPL